MRLHRLVACAFGPFADRVDVDFDALGRAGIFLIQGPTGGGKTSILDAICFALYADVPGGRPAGQSLRSDHAAPGTLTSTSLEFTVGARRLRVTRSPEQERPKVRGTGTRVVPSRVQLEARGTGGQWETISAKAPEVGREIREAVGLGLEQFSRVVMLPQGDFAAFLRAAPEERRALLGTLFDVSRYQHVERWLTERAHESGVASALAEQEFAAAVQRVDDALARLPGEVLPDALPWSELTQSQAQQAGERLMEALHHHAGAAHVRHDQAVGASDEADAILQRLLAIDAAAARGVRARQTLTQLNNGAAQLRDAADQLARHTRAQSVAGDVRALLSAREAASAAAATVASHAVTLAAVGYPDLQSDQVDLMCTTVTAQDDLVADLARLAEDLRAVDGELLRLDAEHAALGAQAEAAALAVGARTQAVDGAQRRVDETVETAGALPAAQARLATLSAQAAALTELHEVRARSQALLPTIDTAVEEATRAGRHVLELHERRIAAMAGELADDLSNSEPCPVCGSTEHPRPAVRANGVRSADVARAQRSFDLAQTRAQALAIEGATLTERVRGLSAQLGTPEPLPDIVAEQLRGAQLDVDRAARAHRDLATARHQLEETQQHRDEAVSRADALRTQIDALCAVREAAAARRTERTARVSSALRAHVQACPCAAVPPEGGCVGEGQDGQAAVTPVIDRHRLVRETLDQARAALVVARDRDHDRDQAAARAATQCTAIGFDTVADASAALLPAARVHELSVMVQSARDLRSAADAVLAEPDVIAALAHGPVDVAAARTAAEHAKNARAQAAADVSGAELACREAQERADDVAMLAGRREERRIEHEQLSRLAATVTGSSPDNALRMRLSAFVLAGRLERVVELANERLVSIGAGRYRLAHTDEVASHGRRSGLGLVVHDLWTGRTRDPATLSGGESFMASLALALGLADAVRQESGGFDLQTLFIDEGFGTLDEESLEHVMEILDTLRDGGRAVGVVSHVADLRTRIPTQLRVHKSTRGSSVSMVSLPA